MLAHLARASLEGALLAAGVWMVIRLLPRLTPAVRAVLWWCVAAKFVVALLWIAPITLPVLPADGREQVTRTTGAPAVPSSAMLRGAQAPAPASLIPRIGARASGDLRDLRDFPWTLVVVSIWGAGLAFALLRTMRQWRDTRGVVARSVPADAHVQAVAQELAARLALGRTADVRISGEIDSPLITGVRRPVILVPADRFPLLSAEQQRMALCHELAHMKRGDLWLGCVPAAVERCFFFHPLARLAAREYAFWREAACDDAVLVTLGASPQAYGRLLLALGVSRGPATFAAAGAAWSFSNLKRRIVMLGHRSSPSLATRALTAGAVALACLAVVPVKAVARPADAASSVESWPQPGVAVTAEVVPAPATASTPSAAVTLARVAPAPAPATAVTAVTLARPTAADVAPGVTLGVARTASPEVAPTQDRRRRDELEFVFMHDDRTTTISGSSGDARRARAFQRDGEPLLWFRRDGREYIVRDRSVLREVAEVWGEVSRIGAEQGRLGAQQGELGAELGRHGAKQGQIGAQQGVIGARQGVIGARLGLLAAREAAGASAAERREMDREREELDREMRALDREMEALGRRMREVGAPPRDVSREMDALGRQMDALGRRMDTASRRAESEMRALIEDAVRSGAAQQVR